MKSIGILSAAALAFVLSAAAPALAANPIIQVDGQLAGNNFVTATCVVGNNGQVTGTGVLYGQNPATGAVTYRYPFTIVKASTATGDLVLTGAINGGPPISLTATVPAGAMVFSYVVNGKTYTLAGQGGVVLK